MVRVKEHQKFCLFREQCWERDKGFRDIEKLHGSVIHECKNLGEVQNRSN